MPAQHLRLNMSHTCAARPYPPQTAVSYNNLQQQQQLSPNFLPHLISQTAMDHDNGLQFTENFRSPTRYQYPPGGNYDQNSNYCNPVITVEDLEFSSFVKWDQNSAASERDRLLHQAQQSANRQRGMAERQRIYLEQQRVYQQQLKQQQYQQQQQLQQQQYQQQIQQQQQQQFLQQRQFQQQQDHQQYLRQQEDFDLQSRIRSHNQLLQQHRQQQISQLQPTSDSAVFCPSWHKAPGAERHPVDELSNNNINQQNIQFSKSVFNAPQAPLVTDDPAQPASPETIACSGVPLGGFAAEIIWEMVHGSSAHEVTVSPHENLGMSLNSLGSSSEEIDCSQPRTPTFEDSRTFPFQSQYLGNGVDNNFVPSVLIKANLLSTSVSNYSQGPDEEFRRFCYVTLAQTLASPTALLLALYYASKIPRVGGPIWQSLSSAPYRLLIVGMQLADKCLSDNTFTNSTWQEVTGIPLTILNSAELWAFKARSFNTTVSDDEWRGWLISLHQRESRLDSRRSHVFLGDTEWVQGRTERGYTAQSAMSILQAFDDHQLKLSGAFRKVQRGLQTISSPARYPVETTMSLDSFDLDEDGPLRPIEAKKLLSFGRQQQQMPLTYTKSWTKPIREPLRSIPAPRFESPHWMQSHPVTWRQVIA